MCEDCNKETDKMDRIYNDRGESSQCLSQLEGLDKDMASFEQAYENKDDDTLLLELVAQYPVLYNKQLKDYKNNVIRETCWGKIAEILHKSPPDCLKRWNQLRESYGREKRRREDECRSGSGPTKRKGFHLFNDMTFLEQHVQRRKTYTNVSVTSSTTDTFAAKHAPNYLKQVCVSQRTRFPIPLTVSQAENCRIPMPLPRFMTPIQLSGMLPVTVPERTLPLTTVTHSPPSSFMTPIQLSGMPPVTVPERTLPFTTVTHSPPSSFMTPIQLSGMPPVTVPERTLPFTTVTPSPPSTCSLDHDQIPATSSAETVCGMPSPPVIMPQKSLAKGNSERPAAMSPVESSCSIPSPSPPSTPTPPPQISTAQRSGPSTPISTVWMKDNHKENVPPSSKYARAKSCYTKEGGKSKNIDPIEESFLKLSSTLQGHFENSVRREERHKQPSLAEQSFANLIAIELEAIPEPLKSSKKARILQVLYQQEPSS